MQTHRRVRVAKQSRSHGRGAVWATSLLATGALLLTAAPALAAPQVDGVFDVTGVGQTNGVAADPAGNVWVTLSSATADVARITPQGGLTEFDLPGIENVSAIAAGPDGSFWVPYSDGVTGRVAKFSPADPASATGFDLGAPTDSRGITLGPDGNLWAVYSNVLVRIDPADPTGGVTQSFDVLDQGRDIAVGGDGRLWVACSGGGGRLTAVTTAGVAENIDTGGFPQGIAAGPGQQVAWANPGTDPNSIGRLTPGGSALLTDVPVTDPFGVAFGTDGAYWIAMFNPDELGRLTPDGQYSTPVPLPAGGGARKVYTGPGNTLWVILETSNQVVRVSGVDPPSGQPPAGPGETPSGQAAGRIRLGNVVRNRRTGQAWLLVRVSAAGVLRLRGNGVRPVIRRPQRARRVALPIRVRGRHARQLRRRGAARIRVAVDYRPVGGRVQTQRRPIRLIR